jgi:hypothetical protein
MTIIGSAAKVRMIAALAACFAVLTSAVPAHAHCDPSTDPDKSDIANARAAVAANCDCAGALTHGAYVSCAATQVNTVLVNRSCAGSVKKCASHSICGKPAGAVTCCTTTAKGTKCKIKRDAAHCTARLGTVGACTSCCDACPAPGSGPSCPITTSTTTTTMTSTTTTTIPFGCDNPGEACGTCSNGAIGVCLRPCDAAPACIADTSISCFSDQDCAPGDVCLSLFMGDYCGGRCATPCLP